MPIVAHLKEDASARGWSFDIEKHDKPQVLRARYCITTVESGCVIFCDGKKVVIQEGKFTLSSQHGFITFTKDVNSILVDGEEVVEEWKEAVNHVKNFH